MTNLFTLVPSVCHHAYHLEMNFFKDPVYYVIHNKQIFFGSRQSNLSHPTVKQRSCKEFEICT